MELWMEVHNEAVEYFCQVLDGYRVNSASPDRLHGHLGQASRDIRHYMQTYYPGPYFYTFFEEDDNFFISEAGLISLCSDIEREAVCFFEEMFENNILHVVHFTEIIGLVEGEDDENYIAEYIYIMYPDEDILNFFEEHNHIFSVANGYVALTCERDLASEEQDAIDYFVKVLKQHNGYFDVEGLMTFAEQDDEGNSIMDLICDYYPGDSICDFLKNHDDVFFMDCQGIIYLKEYVDDDAVEYFKAIFIFHVCLSVHHTSLYSYVDQSPDHVMKYIREDFGKKGFIRFLRMHSDTFIIKKEGFVSYVGLDAAAYFARVLENYHDMPHYSTFKGHIGQAPRYIVDFINTKYPKDKFYDFLLENNKFFDVNKDGYVKHSAGYEHL